MTHTLHPFPNGSQATGSPAGASLSHKSTFSDQEMLEPSMLRVLNLQNQEESMISPVSFGKFFSPEGSTSDDLSPVSTTSERSHFTTFPSSETASPENLTPFARSRTITTTYPHRTNTQPLQLREVHGRPREALAAPYRPNPMYSQGPQVYGDIQLNSLRRPSEADENQPRIEIEPRRTPFGAGQLRTISALS